MPNRSSAGAVWGKLYPHAWAASSYGLATQPMMVSQPMMVQQPMTAQQPVFISSSNEELMKMDWLDDRASVGGPTADPNMQIGVPGEAQMKHEPDWVTSVPEVPVKRVVVHSKKQKPFSKRVAMPAVRAPQRKAEPCERASRWTRDKTRMGDLEHEMQEKQLLADMMEKENKALRLKTAAMEHALAAREKQMSILGEYNRLCGPHATCSYSQEAQEMQLAASSTILTLAAKIQGFVNEASLLLLHISDAERRGDLPDRHITMKLSALVVDMCNRTLCTAFVLNPKIQYEILTRRLDCPESGPSNPEPEHWDRVVMEVHPTQQQLEELAGCWELKNSRNMTKLQPELDTVVCELADALGRNCSLRICELHKRLAAAECKEAMSYRAFCYMLFGRIFTPMQLGRVLVHSFPYFPNSRELAIRLLQMYRP